MKDKDDDATSPAGTDVPAGDVEKTEQDYWDEFDAEEAGTAKAEDDDTSTKAVSDDGEALDWGKDDDSRDDAGDKDTPDPEPAGDDDDAPDTDKTDDADDPEPSIEELKAQTDRLEQKLKSSEGRARGQQRRADRLARELADLQKRSSTKDEADDDGKDDRAAKLAALKEEYPDIAGPLLEEMEGLKKKAGDQSEEDKRRIEEIEDELSGTEEEQIAILTEEHPDAFKLLKEHKDVFEQWIRDQPERYREIHERNRHTFVDGTGAALIISRFRQALRDAEDSGSDEPAAQEAASETRSRDTRRELQKEGARSTRSRGRQAASSEPPRDSPDEGAHWDYWEKAGH